MMLEKIHIVIFEYIFIFIFAINISILRKKKDLKIYPKLNGGKCNFNLTHFWSNVCALEE